MGEEQACDVTTAEREPANRRMGNAGGALIGQAMRMSEEEYDRHNRDARCQQAVCVLQQAREIRADAAFMTDIRAYVRKLRDEGAALLDDLG